MDSQGFLSRAYPKLTAVLLKGLQEQQAQIEGQRGRLAEQRERMERKDAAVEALRRETPRLKARNEGLAERLDALETAMERIQEGVRVSDASR